MTNLFQYAVVMVACIALSGCADAKWPNSLTGEPDESIGQNRAGIPRVDSRGAAWPNLATVPPRPGNVPPLEVRQQQVGRLGQDRTDGAMLLQSRNVLDVTTTQPSTPTRLLPQAPLLQPAPSPALSAPPLVGLERPTRPSAP